MMDIDGESTDVHVASLSDLCRLCGDVDNECVELFGDTGIEEELVAKIENAVRITVSEDDTLPKGICTACREKLLGYSAFYQHCHETQEKLQDFFSIQSAVWQCDDTSQLVSAEEEKDADDYADEEELVYYEQEGYMEEDDANTVAVHPSRESESEDVDQNGTLAPVEGADHLENETEVNVHPRISVDGGEDSEVQQELLAFETVRIKEETFDMDDTPVQTVPQNAPGACKKVVYLVKNASHMPIQSIVSAVLESTGARSGSRSLDADDSSSLRKAIKTRFQPIAPKMTPKKISSNLPSPLQVKVEKPQQILIDPDGTVRMVPSNSLAPSSDVTIKVAIPRNPREIFDSNWTTTNPDHEYTRPPEVPLPRLPSSPSSRSLLKSRFKRARNAVKLSLRTLRPSLPLRSKIVSKKQSSKKHKPVDVDDPNYQVMMENFNKPVSRQTLKRYGLYTPVKRNSNKIDAPYKNVVADYIEKLSDTQFKCKICLTAVFRWNYKAEIHILEHMDWRPFVCNVCGKAFTQNQYLRKHCKLHFPEDIDFICEICGKGFQRRYYLTYHMDEHFDRTYTCRECGKQFSNRRKHDEHVRYHHKCHYAVCDVCGQTMRTTALSRHRRQHFAQTRKRRGKGEPSPDAISCNVCGQMFQSVMDRDEHQEEHCNTENPYHCGICTIYFKTRRSLNEHMQNHTVSEEESQVAARILDELTSGAMVTITS